MNLFSVLSQTAHAHQMQHAALLLLCGGWLTYCSSCIQINRENARCQRARRTTFVLKQAFIIVLNVRLPFWQCIRQSLDRLHIVRGSRRGLATATEEKILLEQVSGPDQLLIYIRRNRLMQITANLPTDQLLIYIRRNRLIYHIVSNRSPGLYFL